MSDEVLLLSDRVREIAYAIHLYLGNGFLEKVYENALTHRLRKAGFQVEQQPAITIYDEDGIVIGDYVADLVVNGVLLVELKACKALGDEHKAQVLHYLKAARLKHGLLINFGSYRFQIQKFVL